MIAAYTYDTLVVWKKNSNGETALLIDSARRVDKSFIAEQSAKAEYKIPISPECAIYDMSIFRSIQCATPSSSLDSVTASAMFLTSIRALETATPVPQI